MEYFGTVHGRIGYRWDRTLVYVTGGLAYADIENSAAFFGPAGRLQFAGNNRRTEAGYTVGAGIEHAFASNWTVKAEYLYYDFRDETVNVAVIPGNGGGGTGYNSRFRKRRPHRARRPELQVRCNGRAVERASLRHRQRKARPRTGLFLR